MDHDRGAELMDARQERRAKNESLFREINEEIEEIRQRLGDGDATEFLCECDDLACSTRLLISPDEYERLRSDRTTFAVAPGHESLDVEDVVARGERFWVVRKHPGAPARIAIEEASR